MRNVSPQLIAWLLQRKPTVIIDLFTFVLVNGSYLYLTSWSNPVTYNGVTFLSGTGNPVVTRSKWSVKNTVEIPELEVDLISTGLDYGSVNIKNAIVNGLFDGCVMTYQRLHLNPLTEAPIGAVTIFAGQTGPVSVTPIGAKITFRGKNVKMAQNFPRNVYTTGCIYTLFGPGCDLERAPYTFNSSCVAGSTPSVILWESDPSGGGFANFGLGYITFLTGVCAGETRTIQIGAATGVQTMYPLFAAPQSGDTFSVTYGCTKTLTSCQDVFHNINSVTGNVKRRAYPFIPPAEMAF